ncbi:MAG: hypothetical protein HYV28_09000 [Ignavibacteriales bacterium]|nr:hypothetical protein [Ignavibacteriales bacterium]
MKTINVCVLLLLISLTSKFVQAQTNGQAWTWREYSHGGNIIRELFQVEVKNAVLVIEPHGAYAELSVYLEYYKTGGNLSTLFQQFTLPPGSVINDYWLWKNNFVIQGCVFEIWPGPSGSLKWPFDTPGPSQLLQSEDQFKLSVKFSDRSFQTIRIKYNFITPMQWEGNHAMFNLPLNLISGGSGNYPLEILFRSADSKWNTPTIQGLQNLVFYDRIDTLGFHYKKAHIHNIKSNTSLRFQIDHQLPDGVLFSNLRSSNDANYFQFGILPSKAFNLNSSDVPSQKSVVAIDLTSDYNKPFPEFFNNISNVLDSAFLAQDSMRMLIAGAGRVKEITENWTKFSHESMNAIIDTFLHSSYGDSVKNQPKLNTIYTDLQAGSTLSMGNLFPYSNYTSFPDFTAARSQISRADRVISYNYNSLTFGDRLEIKASIDSLLEKGGRFIVYANQQRLGIDSLLLSYIPSLQFKMLVPESIWLYRPEGGNLHDEFPPQIINHRINFFSFNDPTFRTELVDDAGNACLISKKTSTGG